MLRISARDLLVVVSSLALCFDSGALRAEDTLVFERDIRPILRARCFDCHGAQEEKKASLDLRLVRFQIRGCKSGPVVLPGRPAESLLVERIRASEMPP